MWSVRLQPLGSVATEKVRVRKKVLPAFVEKVLVRTMGSEMTSLKIGQVDCNIEHV